MTDSRNGQKWPSVPGAAGALKMAGRKEKRMKNEIYKNLLRLEKLEEIANHAEADYERDPENREFEETFARAYKNEFAAFMTVSGQIAKFAGIDEKAARAMVNGKRTELKRILTA